jgi:heparan-alpha-glucosaminide N-acetyltransferase
VYTVLRCAGLLLLIALVALYRRTDPHTGITEWLTFDYPEILGIIGYSYFFAGLCYLSTRRWLWAPVGWFLACLLLNILSSAHVVSTKYPWWILPTRNGSSPALIFAGVIVSTIFFLDPRCNTFARKAVPTLAFGAVAAIAARLLHPLGISKIRATPTWVLYDVAACCAIYCLLYFVCDVKKHTAWAAPFRSGGSNTLLTYLLPDIWIYALGALGSTWWSDHFNYGSAGVIRAVVFTFLMLGISTVLTRLRIRLQI